jgi:hypothetical protein
MANEQHPENGATDEAPTTEAKSFRQKPTKTLPTDRLSFEKQMLILRGIVKASLSNDRGAVANNDAAQYADVAASSVSLCNAFFVDCGLTVREGIKIRPADVVYEFDTAAQWEPETAAHKLAPVISTTWFAKAIMTKLALKPSIPTAEALAFLAQQCNAPLEYKPQLTVLLEYLNACGLIHLDGASITLGKRAAPAAPIPAPPPAAEKPAEIPPAPVPSSRTKRITIALPDKDSVLIEIPENFDADDWVLVADQLVGYIKRWKKFAVTPSLKAATQEDATSNGASAS